MNVSLPTKFTGIIQLAVSDIQTDIDEAKTQYPELVPVSKFHITLMHQKYPKQGTSNDGKRGDKALKALFKDADAFQKLQADFDKLIANKSIGFDSVIQDSEGDRTSVAARVDNQELCQEVLELILTHAGLDYSTIASGFDENESGRVYHVSLLNKTGNGGDSLAYPNFDN